MSGQKPIARIGSETDDAKLQSQSENDSASGKREFTDFFATSDFPTSSLSRLQRLERSAAIEPFDRTQGRLLERLKQAQAKIVLSFLKDRRADHFLG
jgi:hypothetical protein